jgi:hypothetical protein
MTNVGVFQDDMSDMVKADLHMSMRRLLRISTLTAYTISI